MLSGKPLGNQLAAIGTLENIQIAHGVVPVSYTHLDVYKRQVLGGGNYGVLVPPDDSQALATAVLRLLADPTGRQALAARGLKRAEQLSIQNMVGAYETEFLRLAGG